MKNLHILQQESIDEGRLQVRVRQKNMGTPVADARVSVSYSGDPQGKIEETDTNESGSIEQLRLPLRHLSTLCRPVSHSRIRR